MDRYRRGPDGGEVDRYRRGPDGAEWIVIEAGLTAEQAGRYRRGPDGAGWIVIEVTIRIDRNRSVAVIVTTILLSNFKHHRHSWPMSNNLHSLETAYLLSTAVLGRSNIYGYSKFPPLPTLHLQSHEFVCFSFFIYPRTLFSP